MSSSALMADPRLSRPVVRRVVYAAIFLASFSSYLSTAMKDGGLHAPPEAGDGHDWDAVAFNIWRHGRFGFAWSDPEWRRPYEGVRGYEGLLERRSEYYPTTYRPPGAPTLIALVYALTDRNFAAWRVVQCAIMAGAVTAAAAVSAEIAGLGAALVTMALALTLPVLRLYAHEFRSDALAALLVTLLAWIWIQNGKKGWTPVRSVATGLLLGVLAATRSVFLLWIPLTLLAPGADRSSRSLGDRWAGKGAWRGRALAVAVTLLVMGPWWIRNCLVLDAFMPFGTQHALNLPSGFGPRALRFKGLWMSNHGDGAPEIEALNLDPVTSERLLAQHRTALAHRWIREHPLDTLRLMGMHVWQEVKPRRLPYPTGAWLLPVAMVAAVCLRRSAGVKVIVPMIAANMLGITLTWSARGQFMVPVQPMLAALAGAGVVVAARTILELAARLRRGRPESSAEA
jgi:hypothetical protein